MLASVLQSVAYCRVPIQIKICGLLQGVLSDEHLLKAVLCVCFTSTLEGWHIVQWCDAMTTSTLFCKL